MHALIDTWSCLIDSMSTSIGNSWQYYKYRESLILAPFHFIEDAPESSTASQSTAKLIFKKILLDNDCITHTKNFLQNYYISSIGMFLLYWEMVVYQVLVVKLSRSTYYINRWLWAFNPGMLTDHLKMMRNPGTQGTQVKGSKTGIRGSYIHVDQGNVLCQQMYFLTLTLSSRISPFWLHH